MKVYILNFLQEVYWESLFWGQVIYLIEQLHIKNVALIKEAEINFFAGINILSGETGAGKSMVLDSIKFLTGGKANKDFIRSGEEEALVEGIFILESDEAVQFALEMGINVDADKSILISRTLSKSLRGTVKINGRAATLSMLKEFSGILIDIHGQHEHQSLLNETKHIELLDKFCGSRLEEHKNKLSDCIRKYKELLYKIKEITKGGNTLNERLEFLTFQIEEIKQAGLKAGEEEELLSKRKVLANTERLINNTKESIELLYGEQGASDNISLAIKLISGLLETDGSLLPIQTQFENVSGLLDDAIRDLRRYFDDLEHNPEELLKTEARLEAIGNLKRKYGSSVESILEYYEKIKKEYDFIINSEELLKEYNKEKKKLNIKIIETCDLITRLRKKEAEKIEKEIEGILKELGMKDASFKISIQKKSEFSINGNDKVEFLISTNQGEERKGLAKIASGGEMSRVMLALKTVLSKADNIGTFVFDEIDTGVSGRTAQKVAEKLAFISKEQQILCVTHLPQIASMADSHLLIEKFSSQNKTETTVKQLSYEGAVKEIARLLGGAEITEATIAASKELKDMAVVFKEKIENFL